MNARKAVSLFSFAIAMLAHAAIGQQFTRAEIGTQTSILFQNRFLSLTDVGLGGRFTYNFTPSIAIESEVNSYLTNTNSQTTAQDGGRATVALIGPKAGIRRDKLGVFFKARGGVMSFSDAATSTALFINGATARKTHAALDLGVATEFYPSARTILRFDIGRMLVRYGDSALFTFPGVETITAAGHIIGPWHMEVGTGYRLGSCMMATKARLSRDDSKQALSTHSFRPNGDCTSLFAMNREAAAGLPGISTNISLSTQAPRSSRA